jgi:cell division protein FtsB
MNIILSLLATTKSGAVIEIIILLLVAGLIAFLTSYFYYKSVYIKKINALEEEKKTLEKQNSNLGAEITDLKSRIAELEKK